LGHSRPRVLLSFASRVENMPDGVAGAGGKRFHADAAEDMSGDDGMMSADEMVALMNNTKLLMQSSVNGSVMQTGANRDADGTVDRSPPPTEEVQALLFDLKRITDEYGIDMMLEFRTQGGTQYGTISKSRFNSILTATFDMSKGFFWDDAKLNILNKHYGTGANDLALGGNKLVAYMDVCEDLGETDATFKDNPYAHGQVMAFEYSDDSAFGGHGMGF